MCGSEHECVSMSVCVNLYECELEWTYECVWV